MLPEFSVARWAWLAKQALRHGEALQALSMDLLPLGLPLLLASKALKLLQFLFRMLWTIARTATPWMRHPWCFTSELPLPHCGS